MVEEKHKAMSKLLKFNKQFRTKTRRVKCSCLFKTLENNKFSLSKQFVFFNEIVCEKLPKER